MAQKKTKPFEIIVEMDADTNGEVETIDLSQYVEVADMEAFGIMDIECGLNVEGTPANTFGNKLAVQVSLSDLSGGFISHGSYDSLYLSLQDSDTGFTNTSLSLGDGEDIRYVPGGLIDVRTYCDASRSAFIRITGVVSKLSDKDYLSLVMTARGAQ